MLEIGSIVGGKYKVLNVIGQGGMSTVYLAMNERANKQWAIKEVREDAVTNFQLVKQSLITETELLKTLSHPYLPSIVDVIEEDGRFLIVMDYIEGNTLERALDYLGPQPQEYVIEWGIQLCDVLEYLHTREPAIIYRDLKPSNIMLRPNGTITLIDFGTAREYKEENTGDTSYLGTRDYAAPEQFGGMGQTDARTDIYCLGATMYHLVTGHSPSEPPYEFKPIRDWNPSLSPGLEHIIEKCVQSNPEDRYNSCAEVMYDLQNYLELDKGYRKEAKLSVTLFATVLIICFLATVTAIDSHSKAKTMEKDIFTKIMADAKAADNELTAAELYTQAIIDQPNNPEGYLELLDNVFLRDDSLTKDEDELIRQIMITPVENSTVEKRLAQDKDVYAEVAYRYGLAYFYYYNETGNKQMAAKWFQLATSQRRLPKARQERASRLGKISQYYATIGKESKSGDKEVSYMDFWNDLVAIADGNITESDNLVTALVIYKELAVQIYDNANKFKSDGVGAQEMADELDYIERHIEEDIVKVHELTQSDKDQLTETRNAIASALTVLENLGK
ncbi:serine/threonine protein kinase [Butyrivibrio sp. X503]|uniref:serine/threonine protein kinase n=1 Tax=Butyrivibrio sp. X503 TaxID=2364878 RepID=UPI000EA9C73F|nr:serine/threonine-protein kinase [Butyrivibrio sp. X503]RKM55127.1 serine/threonine protein kinase [Butyrivibrio sp. X503]